MLNSFRKLSGHNLAQQIRSLLFFILFYFYLWLRVDMRLIYHGGGVITNFPVFYRGWAFFRQFTLYPGGIVEYLSAFLSQFLYYSWTGALVITLHVWLIFICTGYFLKAINAPRLRWVRFIPPILLLTTYNQYTYHFVVTMAFLAAMLLVCLYLKITRASDTLSPHRKNAPDPLKLLVFFALSIIGYAIAGGAYLLFAALCVIYELLLRRRWQMGAVCLLSALVIPYVEGVLIFNVTAVDAFSKLLPFPWEVIYHSASRRMIAIVYSLYLLVPSTAIALELWRISVGRLEAGQSGTLLRWTKKLSDHSRFKWSLESLVLFAVAGTVAFFSHNNEIKTFFQVDYYAYHKMWPQVIEASHRYPKNNVIVVNTTLQALYYTSRLGYDLFLYPQRRYTMFLSVGKHLRADWQRSETYINLGLINRAEHALGESMERFGERPMILKRMALINMVKDNITAARIYLGSLSKTMFHADWANSYLDKLKWDPNLSTDDQIQSLRSFREEKDYCSLLIRDKRMLLDLLDKNRQNRMAFEYLMAWCLLTGDIEEFEQNLHRLEDFDYSQIPRLYEEAILYMRSQGKTVNLSGRQISPESRLRFVGFLNTYNRYGANKSVALKKLMKNYAGSYLFYSMYEFSGMEK